MTASLRLAYFSPLPPARSGIADYSRELLPHLAQRANLTLFVDRPDDVELPLRQAFDILPITDYPATRWRYDLALYQMGASMFHDTMYDLLTRYSGLMVLHDHGLHEFIGTRTIPRGNLTGYVREMGYALGPDGVELARQIQKGQRQHPFFEVPLNERALDSSLGVMVHSQYVRQQVQARRPNLRTALVPAPIQTYSEALLSRRELGCPENVFIFASVGQVTRLKQVTLALEAFARIWRDFPQAIYLIIGEELKHDSDLQTWIQDHGLGEAVRCTGYIPSLHHFVAWIAATDVLINLRYPTLGETSATALRGLAAAKPVIVTNTGWYSELPDDVCFKVAPNDVDSVEAAMRRLASDELLRREMGRRAAEYARRVHAPARAAQRYIEFARQILTYTP